MLFHVFSPAEHYRTEKTAETTVARYIEQVMMHMEKIGLIQDIIQQSFDKNMQVNTREALPAEGKIHRSRITVLISIVYTTCISKYSSVLY